MKMTSMQFFTLAQSIEKIENAYGVPAMKQHRENVKFAHVQFISFIWSIYHMINADDRKIINEGLQDAHIETVLKIALCEYK